MATADAEASLDERGSPGGPVHDGFISYSHAADDLLAPRLQAGLQRFAKPWWKRRALRIFRDESSLSANPHLWSSITDALDQSAWFVLLLSPGAARSEWVIQEVEYWLEHKDPDRIIPVLTDGDFGWSGGDVTGDAVPPTLQGVFSDEPRWVDLRFARTEEQLDLQNPAFSAAVADVASAIRGVPKDELASEEVRQHRRTVRTAWAAAIALGTLAVIAVVAAAVAIGQSNEAQAQRDEAQRQTVLAEEQRTVAESEAARADAEADRANDAARDATDQAAIANSERLAAEAVNHLDRDAELSMLLSLESIAAAPPGTTASAVGVIALREAMSENRLLARFDSRAAQTTGRLSADASTIYYAEALTGDQQSRAVALDVASGEERWVYAPGTIDGFVNLALSPDEELVAIAVFDTDPTDGLGGRVEIIDAATGEHVRTLTPGACVVTQLNGGFSPDGRWLVVWTGTENCFNDPDADWLAIFDTATWEEAARIQLDRVPFEGLSFSGDGSRITVYNTQPARTGGGTEVLSFPDLDLIKVLPESRAAALSPDGTVAALVVDELGDELDLRPQLVRVDTGQRIAYLDAVHDFPVGPETFRFSPSGSVITVITRGDDYVFDAANGKQLVHLGNTGLTLSQSLSADASTLLTTSDFAMRLWDIGPGVQAGSSIQVDRTPAAWINQNEALDGSNLAVFALGPRGDPTVVLDPETGDTVGSLLGEGEQLADGRFVVAQESAGEDDRTFGPLVVWDHESGSVVELSPCVVSEAVLREGDEAPCAGPFFGWSANTVEASADGMTFAAQAYASDGADKRAIRVWDAATLDIRSEFEIPGNEGILAVASNWLITGEGVPWVFVRELETGELVVQLDGPLEVKAVTPDESILFGTDSEWLFAYDTSTWELLNSWQAHDAQIRGGAVSPGGGRLATTGEDNFVKVWDISSLSDSEELPVLLDRFPADFPSDAAWLSDDELGVFLAPGARYLRVSLSVADVVGQTQGRVTRTFTAEECAAFRIDPCPSLDDIRNR